MTPKISVIIPVYNAEKYLDQCIQSVLNQSFTDFELLLINDGSKDRSGEICDTYAKKDQRIKVFHQENKGVSAARNVGLEHAKGEWITFVDSDDIIINSYLESFISNIGDNDVLFQGIKKKLSKDKMIKQRAIDLEIPIDNNKSLLKVIDNLELIYCGYSFAIMFKTSIIKSNNILFDEDVKKAEDLIFVLQYLLNIKNFKSISNANYEYDFSITDSLSKRIESEKSYLKLIRYINQILYRDLNLENNKYPKISEAVIYNFLSGLRNIFKNKTSIKAKVEFMKSIDNEIYQNVFSKSAVNFKQRFIYWILKKRFFKLFIQLSKL